MAFLRHNIYCGSGALREMQIIFGDLLKSPRVSFLFLDAVDSGHWLQPISRWVLTWVLAEHSVSFIRRVQLGKKQSKLHWSISHQLANLGQICRGQRLDIRAEA